MLQTQELRYAYPGGGELAFPDVALAQGGVLLLSGPSGSGKSTWLALVAALVAPRAGRLTVAGQGVAALRGRAADAWRACSIGFLPQKLHLSAALTVRDNLALAYWAAGLPENVARITQVLAALGVQALAGRVPSQLSGGQAQRVALARAVLMAPALILADEPTASLDDAAAAEAIGLLLQAAKAQQASLVIATHDARVAQALAALGVSAPVRLTLQAGAAHTDGVNE